MDAETFIFYLGKTPTEYAAAGPMIFERVLSDMIALHGAHRAADMGLAYLSHELAGCLNTDWNVRSSEDGGKMEP